MSKSEPHDERDDLEVPYRFGMPLKSALAQRERIAADKSREYGEDIVFPELVDALLSEVIAGAAVLEVGAGTGLLTRVLLTQAAHVTAIEPSPGMVRRMRESDLGSEERLTIVEGIVEDLEPERIYDMAVVTFSPRRGLGLLSLIDELAGHVREGIVLLMEEDGSMDWAYLARAASVQGFEVALTIVSNAACEAGEEQKRAVILTIATGCRRPDVEPLEAWGIEAREVDVPYPVPRGSATRLVRYFLAGGDHALTVRTDRKGIERLYGNLRTAAHRIARDEVTVRRQGDSVQLVRLPRAEE